MPHAIANQPRPYWSGPSSPAATQPRPQAVPAQQRPPSARPATPKTAAPHAAAPATMRPAAVAPHATVPVARSNPEQPQAKER